MTSAACIISCRHSAAACDVSVSSSAALGNLPQPCLRSRHWHTFHRQAYTENATHCTKACQSASVRTPQQHPCCHTALPVLQFAHALKLVDSPGHFGGRAPVTPPGGRYSRQASLLCLLTGCLAQQHALCVHGGQVAGQGRCHPCSCLTGLITQQLVSSDDCVYRACEEAAHAPGLHACHMELRCMRTAVYMQARPAHSQASDVPELPTNSSSSALRPSADGST